MSRIEFYRAKDKHGWLSNFFPSPFNLGGVLYATNEHWYQSNRAVSLEQARLIRQSRTAFDALQAAHNLDPEHDRAALGGWGDKIRLSVMAAGLRAKFNNNPELCQWLLETGDAELVEAPHGGWSDTFWGNSLKPDGSPGENHLGRLLMRVREEQRRTGADSQGDAPVDAGRGA